MLSTVSVTCSMLQTGPAVPPRVLLPAERSQASESCSAPLWWLRWTAKVLFPWWVKASATGCTSSNMLLWWFTRLESLNVSWCSFTVHWACVFWTLEMTTQKQTVAKQCVFVSTRCPRIQGVIFKGELHILKWLLCETELFVRAEMCFSLIHKLYFNLAKISGRWISYDWLTLDC